MQKQTMIMAACGGGLAVAVAAVVVMGLRSEPAPLAPPDEPVRRVSVASPPPAATPPAADADTATDASGRAAEKRRSMAQHAAQSEARQVAVSTPELREDEVQTADPDTPGAVIEPGVDQHLRLVELQVEAEYSLAERDYAALIQHRRGQVSAATLLGDRTLVSTYYAQTAWGEFLSGNHETAAAMGDALDTLRSGGVTSPDTDAETNLLRGAIAAVQGSADSARHYAERALSAFDGQDAVRAAEARAVLGLAQELEGNTREADALLAGAASQLARTSNQQETMARLRSRWIYEQVQTQRQRNQDSTGAERASEWLAMLDAGM